MAGGRTGKPNVALNPRASPQAPILPYLRDSRTVRQLSQSDNLFMYTDLMCCFNACSVNSDYFQAMFTAGIKESNHEVIELKD